MPSLKCFVYCFLIAGILPFCAYGKDNNSYADSLKKVLANAKEDTNKVNLLLLLTDNDKSADSTVLLSYGRVALRLCEQLKWDKGRMNAYKCMGTIYNNTGIKNATKAIECFQNQSVLAEKIRDISAQSFALRCIAYSYKVLGDNKSSLDYYTQSLKIEPDTEVKIMILGTIGNVYENFGDYINALIYYQNAFRTLQQYMQGLNVAKEENIFVSHSLLITIGDVFLSTAQYDKAYQNYKSAFDISSKIKDGRSSKMLKLWSLRSLGKLYKQKRDYANALKNYMLALDISSAGRSDKTEILNEIADIYVEQGELDKAKDYAARSLALIQNEKAANKMLDDYYSDLAVTDIILGKVYARTKQFANAIKYLQEALVLCKKTSALDKESEAWKELSLVYKQTGQPTKALDAYQQYIDLRDSVYSIDKAKAITRMEMQAQIEKDSLKQEEVRKIFSLKQKELGFQLKQQQIYTYSGFAGLLVLVLVSVLMFRNYRQQKVANKIISNTNMQISIEKEKSDTLLLNILPAEVANELKDKGNVKAKAFDNVTVMFTDFVNFTSAGERMTAQQLVDELDACFVAFDEIIGKYHIEKIKTVGDAYLAASGLPIANPDHAGEMVKAAIEIRNFVKKRMKEKGEDTFDIRIGIHSGSVVAGIVGVKKFAYDIWGDTVNTAARMEQNSEEGKINITQTTYDLVKESILCSYRGEIAAKNKGKLKMYFVDGELI